MKTPFSAQAMKTTLLTVSSAVALCSSLETQADPAISQTGAGYRQNGAVITLPATVITPDLQRFDAQADRQNADEAKGPAIMTLRSGSGHTQQIGLIGGSPQMQSNGNGVMNSQALADPASAALALQGKALGAYYSLTGPHGWHVDVSASGGRVNGFTRNEQGVRQFIEGTALTFSIEGGFPIGLSQHWTVEPQAQLINQRVSLDVPYADSGRNSASDLTSWSGRVGARLKGSYDLNGLPVEPYVRTNLWHTVNTGSTVTLDQVDKISSRRSSSTVDLGLGLVAKVTPSVSLYVSADYSSDVDDNDLNGLIGSLGVRMRW